VPSEYTSNTSEGPEVSGVRRKRGNGTKDEMPVTSDVATEPNGYGALGLEDEDLPKDDRAWEDGGSAPSPHEAESSKIPTESEEGGDGIETQGVVEALLFATDAPLPAAKIAQIMGVGDARTVRKHIAALNQRYEQTDAAFRIEEIAGGYQMLTLPKYNTWLAKLLRVRQETRLSPAALETLAIVAYKQPVLRAEIEAIRGVSVGEVLNRLREMNLIKIVGRDEQIGRPMLYGTTKRFLEVFGLASLKDLPKIEELKPPEPAG